MLLNILTQYSFACFQASYPHAINQNGAPSGFEMRFSILGCWGFQPKHVSNPDSVRKKFKSHLVYGCFSGHYYRYHIEHMTRFWAQGHRHNLQKVRCR